MKLTATCCLSLSLAMSLALPGCVTPQEHAQNVTQASQGGSNLTAGKVQREIRVGMTNAEVIESLGSPNLVSTDNLRREVWTYDKVSTLSVHSSSQGGVNALLLGGAPVGSGLGGGAVGGGASYSAGASATSQRTLTIIIKFDHQGKVRDFSYRQSTF